MKRGTYLHPAISRLAARMGTSRPHAVGIVEALWHFTRDYVKDGILGRYSDEEIAFGIYHDGDAAALINALLETGWLLRHETYRFRLNRRRYTPARREIPRRVRRMVLARDGYQCRRCGCTEFIQIDHIEPYSEGGSDDPENLQALCRPCNASKGARLQ